MSNLPKNWEYGKLSQAAHVVRGITFPAGEKRNDLAYGYVCCLRTTNVQQKLEWDDVYYVPKSYVKRDEQLVREGDVLMSMANSYELVGKVARAINVPQPAAFGAFLAAVRPTHAIDGGYLYHFLRSSEVQSKLREGSSQTTNIANISAGKLSELTVPLAPWGEQKRIADKLDTVLTRVDAVDTRLARVAPILKRFRQSVLAAATSGRLTEDWRRSNADGAMHSQWLQRSNKSDPPPDINSLNIPTTWRVLRAQDVVESDANIVYGIVQPGPKLVSGIPYVQTTDIADGRIQVGSLCRTSVDIANRYHRSSIKGGDVLLGIIRATKVAVVPDELSGGNISRSVARLRPCSDMVPQFLAIVLESPAVQDWLRAQHRGMDMPVLNLAQVRLAPLPIAPIDEQREIVRRVETLFAFADRLEARLRIARSATERLTPALLAKAFRGELVPQDPNDEPASELLRRLQQEAPSTSTKRGRKSTA